MCDNWMVMLDPFMNIIIVDLPLANKEVLVKMYSYRKLLYNIKCSHLLFYKVQVLLDILGKSTNYFGNLVKIIVTQMFYFI